MLARCARCQGTFTTDRYGRQTCPHCGSELILPPPPGTPPEPEAEAGAPPAPPTPPSSPEGGAPGAGGGTELPPPGGYVPPPTGWGPPAGGGWSAPPGGYPPPPGGGWGQQPPGGWGPPPGPPPAPGPEQPSPWADRARLGLLRAFFDTWKLMATQPELFFSRVRKDQTGAALLFGVIAATIGRAAAAFYDWAMGAQATAALQGWLSSMPEDQARFARRWLETTGSPSWAIGQVVLTPIAVLVGSYLAAAIVHLLLRLFRGAHRGFDATLTVVAYLNGLNLLLAIPGCGSMIAFVWMFVALIAGLAAAHRCGMGRAAAAVLAPAALLLVCCCGVAGTGLGAIFKAAQDATQSGKGTTTL